MIEYKNVQSTVKPKDIVIDEYSVWVSTNIHEIINDCDGAEPHTEYEFDMAQYSKDEYINLLDERNKSLEDKLTDTQLAICEVYELIGG